MPYEFKPFDYGAAIEQGNRNALLASQIQNTRQQNYLNQLKLQDIEQGAQNKNAISELTRKAAGGDNSALIEMAKYDIDSADKVRSFLESSNKEQREQFKHRNEILGRAAQWADTPEKWDHAMGYLTAEGIDVSAMRGKFSEHERQKAIMFSGLMNDAVDTYGQPVEALDSDGKPAYVQFSKYGNTRKAVGYSPMPNSEPLVSVYDDASPTGSRMVPRSQATGSYGAPQQQQSKQFTLSASDENAITRQAASLFGGIVDPTTGQISGLKEGQAEKVQAISDRASRLFYESEGRMTRSEATSAAAREFGVAIAKGGGVPSSNRLPAPKNADDFAQLPPGTRYLAPDGSVRIKQ